MKLDKDSVREWITLCQHFTESYKWLSDAFVLDFFQDDHWGKLPMSWSNYLIQLLSEDLGRWLVFEEIEINNTNAVVPPLSLLSWKAAIQLLSINRQLSANNESINELKEDQDECLSEIVLMKEFVNLFTRHVKPKKRHEIQGISKVITSICEQTKTNHLLDIGSGLGHLSRFLTYGCGLHTTCIDSEQRFGNSAGKFDQEILRIIAKSGVPALEAPQHICLTLETNKHENYLESRQDNFGIVGLHTCGNLAPVVLHNFINSPSTFVASVGCCYMKMDEIGFPMSEFCKTKNLEFSYEALEVACHAIEQYSHRLKNGGVNHLKVHCYRATLETILVEKFGIKRAGLRSVSHADRMPFKEYCFKATKTLNIELQEDDVENDSVSQMLQDWYKVVLFYSLRLMLATVIESAVLLDRCLFLMERCDNVEVSILPIFNPDISARNLAIFGVKKS